MQADAAEATKLFSVLGKHGFILAVEVRSIEVPQGQVTLIIPGAGAKPGPLFGALRLIAGLSKADVREKKVDGRAVSFIDFGVVRLAWWAEGGHALVNLSTDSVEAMVNAARGKGNRLTDSPLFKRVRGFNQFETGARAF